MDDRDRQLIDLLRVNARAPVASLARSLGVARATVQERLRRLERERVIGGYTVTLGDSAEARRITAHVLLKTDAKASAAVIAAMKKLPEIRTLQAISGTYDYVAVIEAESTERIDAVLDALGLLPGVKDTLSFVVLSTKIQR